MECADYQGPPLNAIGRMLDWVWSYKWFDPQEGMQNAGKKTRPQREQTVFGIKPQPKSSENHGDAAILIAFSVDLTDNMQSWVAIRLICGGSACAQNTASVVAISNWTNRHSV